MLVDFSVDIKNVQYLSEVDDISPCLSWIQQSNLWREDFVQVRLSREGTLTAASSDLLDNSVEQVVIEGRNLVSVRNVSTRSLPVFKVVSYFWNHLLILS